MARGARQGPGRRDRRDGGRRARGLLPLIAGDVRLLGPDDAAAFQTLRLRGLAEHPDAFASSVEEERDAALAAVAGRLVPGPGSAVFGAFRGGALVGVAGIYRERHVKTAHKATLWGMYVAPEARRTGVGRRIVDAALAHAFGPMGLRQVNLGVNAANAPALALYRAAGFVAYGTERACLVVDGVPHDEVLMACARGTARPA